MNSLAGSTTQRTLLAQHDLKVAHLEQENNELRKRIKRFDHQAFSRIDTLERYDRVYSQLTIIETLSEQPDVKGIASKALEKFAITEHLPAAIQAAKEMDILVSENFELRDVNSQLDRIINIQVHLREAAERALLDKSKEVDTLKRELKHLAAMECVTPKRKCFRRSKNLVKYCASCYAKQVLAK